MEFRSAEEVGREDHKIMAHDRNECLLGGIFCLSVLSVCLRVRCGGGAKRPKDISSPNCDTHIYTII